MNVLFVSEYFPPIIRGGGEINLEEIANSLVDEGVNVTVLTSFHPNTKREEIKNGVKILRRLKTGSDPSSFADNLKRRLHFPRSVIREVKKIASETNFDAIHFIGTSILAASELKDLNIPLFATIESYPALCPKGDRIYHGKKECKIKCNFTKFISCQADSAEIGKMKNTVVTKYNPLFHILLYRYYKKLNESLGFCNIIAISKYIQNLLKFHGHSSTVIPNIINIAKFQEKRERKENKIPVVLYLGSLTRYKGPQILLRAIRGMKVEGRFYGKGPLREELQGDIKKYSVNARIYDPVPYEQVPDIYNQADIVVFPSIWPEPFGRIAVESMAAGKIVIGSAIGGIKETIEKGSGILVKPGDVKDLQNALQKSIQNSKEVDKKIQSRKVSLQEYTAKNITIKIIKTYMNKGGKK